MEKTSAEILTETFPNLNLDKPKRTTCQEARKTPNWKNVKKGTAKDRWEDTSDRSRHRNTSHRRIKGTDDPEDSGLAAGNDACQKAME